MRISSTTLAARFRVVIALEAAYVMAAAYVARGDSTVTPSPSPSAAANPAAAAPVLATIVGESITGLLLEDASGRVQRFPIVKGTIALPPGDYSVADVQVGGWRYHSQHAGPWFTHSAESPARLSLGAPLRGKVQIKPSGRRIDLNFSVVDAEGRTYNGRTPQPPRVEIYAGEKLSGSGTFRYG
jgi:hypothetical protein